METQDSSPLSPATKALIAGGNLVPLLGVLLWHWEVFDLMLLYWTENLVIGGLTILAMLVAGALKGGAVFLYHLVLTVFFFFHYSLFCMGHGALIFSLFRDNPDEGLEGGFWAPIRFFYEQGLWQGFIWAIAGLVVVQIVQLVQDWPKFRLMDPGQMMGRPYARIIILHVTLIFGGLLIQALGEPVLALILLVLLKTGVDLNLFAIINKMKQAKKSKAHDAG